MYLRRFTVTDRIAKDTVVIDSGLERETRMG
jgi:hypothetical protein